VPDLLRQIDGRELHAGGVTVKLATQGAPVTTFEQDWRSRLLAVITDPSLALILMLVGIYGLLFEFSNPGFVLPGVVGAICLLLGCSRCRCCRSTTRVWRSSCSASRCWWPRRSCPPSE
jgi:membrane-bound serine protease (ClpP class)